MVVWWVFFIHNVAFQGCIDKAGSSLCNRFTLRASTLSFSRTDSKSVHFLHAAFRLFFAAFTSIFDFWCLKIFPNSRLGQRKQIRKYTQNTSKRTYAQTLQRYAAWTKIFECADVYVYFFCAVPFFKHPVCTQIIRESLASMNSYFNLSNDFPRRIWQTALPKPSIYPAVARSMARLSLRSFCLFSMAAILVVAVCFFVLWLVPGDKTSVGRPADGSVSKKVLLISSYTCECSKMHVWRRLIFPVSYSGCQIRPERHILV